MNETPNRGYPEPNANPADLLPQIAAMIRAVDLDLGNWKDRQAYIASVTQSSASAPTATIGENSLPGLPIWARSSGGVYTLTLTGAFPSGRTKIFLNPVLESGSGKAATAVRTSDDVITVSTVATDGVLADTAIEILVYPQIVYVLLLESGFALLQENGNVIDLE